jgi:hypothetical protein
MTVAGIVTVFITAPIYGAPLRLVMAGKRDLADPGYRHHR